MRGLPAGHRAASRAAALWVVSLVATVLCSHGPAGARPYGGPLSPVVLPPRPYPEPFEHRPHLAATEVSASERPCAVCHPSARQALRSTDELRPDPRTCHRCHNTQTAAAGATPWPPVSRPWGRAGRDASPTAVPPPGGDTRRLRFSHRLHGAEGCLNCHVFDGQGGRPYPDMQRCLQCHRERGASARCPACHPAGPDGRLLIRFDGPTWREFGPPPDQPAGLRLGPAGWLRGAVELLKPSGSLAGARHGADWAAGPHAAVAAGASRFCGHCHADRWCRSCHASRVRPLRVHPAGWGAEHGLAARAGRRDCQTCHRPAHFCRPCHQRSGVAARGEATLAPFAATTRFHPSGWASWTPGAGHHSRRARSELMACAACHQERTCVRCHAPAGRGGGGFNPHAQRVGKRCATMLRAAGRACRQCHGGELQLRPECR